MDKELLISVIIPIYNSEKFLARAVDSVVRQMDGQIELILVDDGSVDASGTICDQYAAKYTNIQVIHKKNGGTSSAKNQGIRISRGRYLSFMDSDDFLDPTTYAEIIPVLLAHQPDCLDFGWNHIDIQGNAHGNLHKLKKDTLLSRQDLETVILPPLLNLCKDDDHFIFDFACNKIFKAEIIHKHNVHFDEDKKTWEDRTFLLRHLKYCNSYYCMDRCFYNYVYTPNSLSQRYDLNFFKIILANFRHYRELFQDRFDFDTQFANNYWAHSIENMIRRSLAQTEDRELIRQNILDTLRDDQVIYWYSKRVPNGYIERKTSALVTAGMPEKAVRYYKPQKTFSASKKLKAAIRKILKR